MNYVLHCWPLLLIPIFQSQNGLSTFRAVRSATSGVMYSNYLASAEEADSEATVFHF